MFVSCENCHRVYDVPEESLAAAPLAFRCSGCGFVFKIAAAEPILEESPEQITDHIRQALESEMDDDVPDDLERFDIPDHIQKQDAIADVPAQERRPNFTNPLTEPVMSDPDVFTPVPVKERIVLHLLVVLLSMTAIAVLSLGWIARYQIASLYPETRPIYNALHIETSVVGQGLSFYDIAFDLIDEDGGPTLLLKGGILNVSGEEKSVPFIRILLLDKNGRTLQEQTLTATENTLLPLQKLPFETKIKPAQKGVVSVDITFRKVGS